MRHFSGKFMNVIIAAVILIVGGIVLPPASPVTADDIDWPEFEKIDGQIDGYVLPLSGEPNVYGDRDPDGYLHYNSTYRDGEDRWREIVLHISYYPNTHSIYPGGLPEMIERNGSYNHLGQGGESGLKWLNENKNEPDFNLILLENRDPNRFSCLYFRDNKSLTIPWIGHRMLAYRDNFIIAIEGEGNAWNSGDEFVKAFDMAEQYARDAIDRLKGGLTLKYYDSITTAPGGDYTGGDLVAMLTNDKGRGVGGKEVFFFKGRYDLDDADFNEIMKFPESDMLSYDPGQYTLQFDDDYFVDSTDASGFSQRLGEGRWNFIAAGAIDYQKLIEYLKTNDILEGTIFAVVFNKDPRVASSAGDLPRIEYIQQVTISLRGVAAIVNRGMADSGKSSMIKVGPAGNQKVVGNDLPYYLGEDSISFDANSIFTVRWLNGLEMTFKVKEDYGGAGDQTITINYKDAGWYQWFDQTFGNTFVEMVVTAAPTVIAMAIGGTTKAAALIGGPISLGIAGVVFVYEGAQYLWDPVAAVPHSQILFDFGEEISAYTVEGIVQLYHAETGEMVEVAKDRAVTISPPGDFGEVVPFDKVDMSPDLQTVMALLPVYDTTNGTIDDSEAGGGSSAFIYIIIAVVIVGLLVGFVLVRKRR